MHAVGKEKEIFVLDLLKETLSMPLILEISLKTESFC
jgi:hypothetical protein